MSNPYTVKMDNKAAPKGEVKSIGAPINNCNSYKQKQAPGSLFAE